MNLPTDRNYKIKSITYSKLEDGLATCCDNCNKVITNIAQLEDSLNKEWKVGLDCAETLSSIKNDFDEYWKLEAAKETFQKGKSFRSRILKELKKEHQKIDIEAYTSLNDKNFFQEKGAGFIDVSGRDKNGKWFRFWKGFPKSQFNIIFEMIKDLI